MRKKTASKANNGQGLETTVAHRHYLVAAAAVVQVVVVSRLCSFSSAW